MHVAMPTNAFISDEQVFTYSSWCYVQTINKFVCFNKTLLPTSEPGFRPLAQGPRPRRNLAFTLLQDSAAHRGPRASTSLRKVGFAVSPLFPYTFTGSICAPNYIYNRKMQGALLPTENGSCQLLQHNSLGCLPRSRRPRATPFCSTGWCFRFHDLIASNACLELAGSSAPAGENSTRKYCVRHQQTARRCKVQTRAAATLEGKLTTVLT